MIPKFSSEKSPKLPVPSLSILALYYSKLSTFLSQNHKWR